MKVPVVSNTLADIPRNEYSWRKYGHEPIKVEEALAHPYLERLDDNDDEPICLNPSYFDFEQQVAATLLLRWAVAANKWYMLHSMCKCLALIGMLREAKAALLLRADAAASVKTTSNEILASVEDYDRAIMFRFHGSETVLPDVSHRPSFVIMLVSGAVASQGWRQSFSIGNPLLGMATSLVCS
ncbi:hypothetical protein Tco_0580912, partial [Tanacetum coccineum]